MSNNSLKNISAWNCKQIQVASKNEKLNLGIDPIEFDLGEFDNKYFRRKLVCGHIGFQKFIEHKKRGKRTVQITGIAPTGSLHFGHIPIIETYLHFNSLGIESKFVIADIDAFISRSVAKVANKNHVLDKSVEAIANLLSMGVGKDQIYLQSKQQAKYYELAFDISKYLDFEYLFSTYNDLDVGRTSANLLQYSDMLHLQLKEFGGKALSVSPVGVDQLSHARTVLGIVKKTKPSFTNPSFVFVDHLRGIKANTKMSKSDINNTIFLNDTEDAALNKLKKADTNFFISYLSFFGPDNQKLPAGIGNSKTSPSKKELFKICLDDILECISKQTTKFEKKLKIAEKIVYG